MSIFATPQSDRKLNAAPAVCSCGHSIAEHFDCLGGKEAGCYHSDNAVFCPCNKDPEQVRLSILAARVVTLEAALREMTESFNALMASTTNDDPEFLEWAFNEWTNARRVLKGGAS
jgi:hypothetical protein